MCLEGRKSTSLGNVWAKRRGERENLEQRGVT
jgi:hypothetical protein